MHKRWSHIEESLLLEYYEGNIKVIMPIFPDRTYKEICSKIERMKIGKQKYHKWTKEDILYVVQARLDGKTQKEIACDLGISEMSVRLITHRKIKKI